MRLTLRPDMQISDGPAVGLGIDPHAHVFQYEVGGWPISEQKVLLRDMRTTGEAGRWRISWDNAHSWDGDYENAEAALAALEAELRDGA